jgi:hypothetical protein
VSWRLRWVPRLWAVALAVLLLWPVLGRGYVLSYDMVWVPDLRAHAQARLHPQQHEGRGRRGEGNAGRLDLLTRWIPIIGLVGGLLLVALGFVLVRSRRRTGSHAAEPPRSRGVTLTKSR